MRTDTEIKYHFADSWITWSEASGGSTTDPKREFMIV